MTSVRTYRFRLHWKLEPGRMIEGLENSEFVSLLGIGMCKIKVTQEGTNETETSLAIVGPAVESAEMAAHQAERALRGLLEMSLRDGFALQLQPRTPPPVITQYGMELIAQQIPDIDTIYRDRLGITIFEERGLTKFAGIASPTISVRSKLSSFISEWNCEAEASISLRNLIAYELYASSRFESSSRARFLLLVMAVEALGCQIQRPTEELLVIERLLEEVERTQLPVTQRDALMDGIRSLKKVSINATCQKLISHAIDSAAVTDPEATCHFRDCYKIRGKIVHSGKTPPPGRLTNESNRLEKTVRELIVWSLKQDTKNSEQLWISDYAVILGEADAVHVKRSG